ncbi:MAG: hypothetical protein WD077_07285 [Bacteroidia bacterium]
MKLQYLLLIMALLILYSGCKKDTGPDERDAFTGRYEVDEYCDKDSAFYHIEIVKTGSGNKVEIRGDGLYETGFVLEALITGRKLTIPIQQVEISAVPHIYFEFSGSGSLSDNYLRIDYQVFTLDEGLITSEDSCTAFCYM